ncbi:phosphoethanolamine transferase [Pantoea cypripedii]|uniref:phosphoethanolamine transferase n=1 Tax=Pantoea cypripedii TaxID=55209 RepID=UPI001301FEB9|nr:phosphoethanolamine transferase [Pantoea cypripedii]MBP2199998.1 glucan phosphoethanolaminetransferase (alkaline phosphatase superfamily) [Pantoea cypripedii]
MAENRVDISQQPLRLKENSVTIKSALKWIIPAALAAVAIPVGTGYAGVGNVALTFIILLIARKNPLTFYFSGLMLLLLSLYIPVGYNFGRISYPYVVSALQTNPGESREFLQGVSFTAWLLFVMAITSLLLFIIYGSDFGKKHQAIYLILFVIVNINSFPNRMTTQVITSVYKASLELKKLRSSNSIPDDFPILSHSGKYKNVIVIIGESVARDYLSVYGYQHNTTPWLNTAPGLFFTDYISTAPNTYLSLPRTLALSDGVKTQENNNIVALANRAGFNTFWVSNQGFLATFDTPATIIGNKANHQVFFKKGDFDENDTDDMALLEHLHSIVNENHSSDNAVFLHMIGSHPDTCSRLNGYPVNLHISQQEGFNCYLATLQKLDTFIQRAHDILEHSGESYALIYFSDHGMSIDNSVRPVRHGSDAQQNYNVPFFILTSDNKKHLIDSTPISARYFMALFSWLTGINSELIPARSPAQVADQQRTVFNGNNLIPYNELKNNDIIK